MMFNEGDHVKIPKFNVTGTIIDKSIHNMKNVYVVEDDIENNKIPPGHENEVYGDRWLLYNCYEDDLEKI